MYNKKLIGFFLIALILAVCIGTASASENTTLTSANEEKTAKIQHSHQPMRKKPLQIYKQQLTMQVKTIQLNLKAHIKAREAKLKLTRQLRFQAKTVQH